jgi:hypothetical protein
MGMRKKEVCLKADVQGCMASEINQRAEFERALLEDRS